MWISIGWMHGLLRTLGQNNVSYNKKHEQMKSMKLLLLTCLISLNIVFAQENSTKDLQTVEISNLELPRIQVIPIKDTKADRQYELYIKLPEEYAENNETKYPVIYYTDAMWHVELLSAATEYIIEDVILVGISWQKDINADLMQEYGAHASRFTDYSFWKKANPKHPKLKFGQADTHLAFIRNDVIKYIENTYRTNPDNRSYFGYSLGGLFGAYTLLAEPDTFKNYILGSPSVRLLADDKTTVEFKNKKINANVFISYGDLEKDLDGQIKTFVNFLEKRGNENLTIKHASIEGDHQTAFPMTGVRSMNWLSDLIKE